VAWLVHISSLIDDDVDLQGMPNIAQNESVLGLVWDHITRLQTGTLTAQVDA
jgi:hypothetical protein